MKKTFRLMLLVSAVGLIGCDSFEADVRTFCRASSEAPWDPAVGFLGLSPWLAEHLHNEEFREILNRITKLPPPDSFFVEMDSAVARAGLTSCPTLDRIKQTRKP